MDIYAAGEEPLAGVSAAVLAAGIRDHGHRSCVHAADRPAVLAHLRTVVQPGDMVITLGAGNVWQVGEDFLAGVKG
jgi:UDP-N-acetylmuramate--alanine ligase